MRVHYGFVGKGLAALLGLAMLTGGFAPSRALAAAAQAKQGKTKTTSEIRTPIDVSVTSFDSREHTPPRPDVTPIRRDPMGVQIAGAKEGTTAKLFRQARSTKAAIPKCVGSECTLQEAAKNAVQWVHADTFKTKKRTLGTPDRQIVSRNKKVVFWPNTRFKVEATAPDGRAYPTTHGIVAGLPAVQETHYDFERNGMVGIRTGGTMLPSARAWIEEGNLYVSEPAKNPKQIAQGRAKIAKAVKMERAAAVKQAKMTRYSSGQLPTMTGQQYNLLAAEYAVLTSDAQTLRAEGQSMIHSGENVAVNIISAAAFPVAANVSTRNMIQGHQKHDVTHAETGYLMQRIPADHQDQLSTTVSFPAVREQKVGSTRTINFDVPSKERKHAFELDGVKYYQVKAKGDAVQTNDAHEVTQ